MAAAACGGIDYGRHDCVVFEKINPINSILLLPENAHSRQPFLTKTQLVLLLVHHRCLLNYDRIDIDILSCHFVLLYGTNTLRKECQIKHHDNSLLISHK